MSKPVVEFWYEFASTYSYLAAMRIEEMAQKAGATLQWRPFLLGPIFAAQGWNDSPFNLYPVKGRYMWRDMARLCAAQGLALKAPVRFPQNGLKAARIVLIGAGEGWVPAFTRGVYLANFAEQKDISEEAMLSGLLTRLGQDPTSVLAKANAPENKDALKRQTEEAKARGIFGAPSFTVGEEVFWGNDRLEAALEWANR